MTFTMIEYFTVCQMFEENGPFSFVADAPLADHFNLGLRQVDQPQPSLNDDFRIQTALNST